MFTPLCSGETFGFKSKEKKKKNNVGFLMLLSSIPHKTKIQGERRLLPIMYNVLVWVFFLSFSIFQKSRLKDRGQRPWVHCVIHLIRKLAKRGDARTRTSENRNIRCYRNYFLSCPPLEDRNVFTPRLRPTSPRIEELLRTW